MKKWVLMSLAFVFFLAIFMRILPLTQYAVWGSDTGEYYYITSQLVSDGYVSTDYDGWGFGYPYFPGMFYLTGSVNFLTGIELFWAVTFTIPIVASFSVLMVFFIAKFLFKNNVISILASAFVAVAMPHVFPTSHSMPGSLGDVLLISTILLLILIHKSRRFIPLAVLSALALIMTHHLSSFFLFIAVLGGLFLIEILKNKNEEYTVHYWFYLLFFITVLILYWVVYAPPFTEGVISSAFDIPYWAILSAGYFILFLTYLIIKLRKRYNWKYVPKFPNPQKQLLLFLVLLLILFFVLFFMAFIKIPGTDIEVTPNMALLYTPLVILLAFTSIGAGYLRFYRGGTAVYGWILALVMSLIVAIITSNRVLLTYRHPQYLMVPLSLSIAMGIVIIYYAFEYKKKLIKGLIVASVILLLVLTSISAYPSPEIMGGFQEGTSQEDMNGVYWARESLSKPATVATDHRMSSMLFGFAGLNATWDEAKKTLHVPTYTECQDEIASLDTSSGKKSVDYILLDEDIKKGAALLQWENAEPMSKEAQEKFEMWPFVKLYEANGVEIYGLVVE